MTWQEVVTMIVPVIGVIVPIALLIMQLRRQDQTERKRVEVEYLRQAIDVLELPVRALRDVQSKARQLAWQKLLSRPPEISLHAVASEFNAAIERAVGALVIALTFAETAGNAELRGKLKSFLEQIDTCRSMAAEAYGQGDSGRVEGGSGEDPRIVQVIVAKQDACRALVRRIHELYG